MDNFGLPIFVTFSTRCGDKFEQRMQQKLTFSVVTAVGKNLKKECNKIKLFPVAIAVGRNLSHLSPAPVMIIASSLETAAKTLGNGDNEKNTNTQKHIYTVSE